MNKTPHQAAFFKVLPLLVVLAITILWVSRSSYAQTPGQSEDNGPRPGMPVNQAGAGLSQSEDNGAKPGRQMNQAGPGDLQAEDNGSRARSAALPDLVITDPNADVREQVQAMIGGGGGPSQVIPAAAFTVDGSTRQWFFGFNSAYLYPSGGSYCGIAPVYLPNGATVTAFIAYAVDNYASADVNVYLYAKPLGSTTTSTDMADLGTTGQNASLQALVDTTILQPVIDNSSYTYHIGVCLLGVDSSMSFYTAQILYSR